MLDYHRRWLAYFDLRPLGRVLDPGLNPTHAPYCRTVSPAFTKAAGPHCRIAIRAATDNVVRIVQRFGPRFSDVADLTPLASAGPFPCPPRGSTLIGMGERGPDAERQLTIVAPGDPVVEPDLGWDAEVINASGGRDPLSGFPLALHEVPAEE